MLNLDVLKLICLKKNPKNYNRVISSSQVAWDFSDLSTESLHILENLFFLRQM